ncbi:M23 family metallopeptidase [Aliivibrio fischeri]|uniref:Membrane protein n=1 Tax=Aliivibrio fischeri (strain MJ11) TaxID=388396 RepID=B5FAP9_ALIFM|nr:M23 family metallopeptidase [Aliivibrio fischeri]ACH66658.1 membrane protein [Aliivibrio fischeri MJ11]MCE4936378.1 peptidoglycan DD-metalloendopeptidase family protein [Aliivibrio fischeri]MUH96034.1 peptidoglycan DD-metalloendopeptidase family protein [Aliivibrio fischeri]MUI65909.1 peptidoglycan DD-metalloendopeptidase family protein [Aliivibrio fischeri]OCH08142.1 peptidase M23 [Aliivibrio fischeri]
MPDKIRISVSHNKGTRLFAISQRRKKLVILSLVLGISSFALSGFGLHYFYQQQESAKVAIAELQNKNNELNQLIVDNNNSNHELTQQLEAKENELLVISQRVDDVESVLGLQEISEEDSSLAEKTLEQRLDVAAIDSAVRATMFRLIPNDTPLHYTRESSSFGRRTNPISGKRQRHLGVDLTCKRGTEIYAPADGVVELARASNKGYGNLLKVQHSFGFMTMYAHLQKFKVRSGQFVKKGELIATCGNSGNSTGPHLHYEVRFLGRVLNPRSFMDWTPEKFDSLFEKERSVKWTPLVDVINNVVKLQLKLTQKPTVEQVEAINTAKAENENSQQLTQ